jgi:hypothetical protein
MARLFSTVCLLVGIALVAVSLEPAVMREVAVGLLGVGGGEDGVAAALAVAASLVGMGLMIIAFVGWTRHARIEVGWSFFQGSLGDVASQYGAEVRRVDDRLSFTAGQSGLVFEVAVRPTRPGSIEISALLPVAQRIELLPLANKGSASLEERFARVGTHRVTGGVGWEVRSAGGPRGRWLVESPGTRRALDRLYAWPQVRRLVQDKQGARVHADLVGAHELSGLIQVAVDAMHAIKAVPD